jgi:predicted transcriptional regulator
MVKFGISVSSKIRGIEERIKKAFKTIKEELEEHLNSINENTNEIQYNSEQIYELSKKIDKLSQRIDEIELIIANTTLENKQDFSVSRFDELTKIEREIFLILYKKKNLTLKDISNKLALSEDQVKKNIANLIIKGIPIIKRYSKESMFIGIDNNFLLAQIKNNLMEIDKELLAE